MQCPECDKKMIEVKTSSHYGIPIVIDQCQDCGGLWFDDTELYRTKHGVAHEIEKRINIPKLRQFTYSSNEILKCPCGQENLVNLNDKYFPQGIQIKSCKKCGGFWFNHGQFTEFQTKRMAKINAVNNSEIVVKNEMLDKKLDGKIKSVMTLYSDLYSREKKAKEQKMIGDVGYILWILLRILLKI